MGVGAGEEYYSSVTDFKYETFGEEAVGFCKGGGDNVGEGFGNAGCRGVKQVGFSDGKETVRGKREGGGSF